MTRRAVVSARVAVSHVEASAVKRALDHVPLQTCVIQRRVLMRTAVLEREELAVGVADEQLEIADWMQGRYHPHGRQ